jgi:hypothetical protein
MLTRWAARGIAFARARRRTNRQPQVDIAHGGGAVFVGGVAVGGHLAAQLGIADVVAPAMRVADKETLIAGAPVVYLVGLAAEREAVGDQRSCQSLRLLLGL